jgi:hypothetical protein
MNRFCIFCGEKPECRSIEHVIPQWLIRLTGNPNRRVYLGIKWASPNPDKREFSFNSFAFPACGKCNSAFSDLETRAKSVVETVLAHGPLASCHWDTFLDWLDKVRIGIWLGMIYLNQNHLAVTPGFHIKERIGSKDRFVIVYEIEDDGDKGVGWGNTESPLFGYMPSCFTLIINNFIFLNASSDFLFSERFGFPFLETRVHREEGGMWGDLVAGTESLRFPLVKRNFKTGGTQLFQPMFRRDFVHQDNGDPADVSELYDTQYVRSHCKDFDAGRGQIYMRDRNRLVVYSDTPSREWVPKQRFPRRQMVHETARLAGEYIEELYRARPTWDSLPDDLRLYRKAEFEGAIGAHRRMMKLFFGAKGD